MVARREEGMSVEDFLALDHESLDQEYEYRDGHMVAMAGGSKHHAAIITYMQSCVTILRAVPVLRLPRK